MLPLHQVLIYLFGASERHFFQALSHQLQSLLVLNVLLILLVFFRQHVVVVTDDDETIVQVEPCADQVRRAFDIVYLH